MKDDREDVVLIGGDNNGNACVWSALPSAWKNFDGTLGLSSAEIAGDGKLAFLV